MGQITARVNRYSSRWALIQILCDSELNGPTAVSERPTGKNEFSLSLSRALGVSSTQ